MGMEARLISQATEVILAWAPLMDRAEAEALATDIITSTQAGAAYVHVHG